MTVVIEHADHLVLANTHQLGFDWMETVYNNQPRYSSSFLGVRSGSSLANVRNFSTYLGKIPDHSGRTAIKRKTKERIPSLLDTNGSALYFSDEFIHVSHPFCCVVDERIKTWV